MPKFDFVGGLLTDEETDVLQLRRRGWRNADIAAELNLSERTVKRRVHSIKTKIGWFKGRGCFCGRALFYFVPKTAQCWHFGDPQCAVFLCTI